MTAEEQARLVIVGLIAEAPPEQRAKVEAALVVVRRVAATEEGRVAIGLVALEIVQ